MMNINLPANLTMNANQGFLCLSTHWTPNPNDSDPNLPGNKVMMTSYVPVMGGGNCLCGSRKLFSDCCQAERLWHPICPNIEFAGYSLIIPQTATYKAADTVKLRRQLINDVRFHCVDDSREKSFWIYWGDPAVKDEYGILCFGDIELEGNGTFTVRAMSNSRMERLQEVIEDLSQGGLDFIEVVYSNIESYKIDKERFRPREQEMKRKHINRRRKNKK